MTKLLPVNRKLRKQYMTEFRDEALKLVKHISVASVARELSPYKSKLYNWRSKQQNPLPL
ncbi:transposase [Pantoea sp. Acro-835]|uniref:Transposase n=1 Tax=Candidatus Pantoea multigeneris TaxID=2608357 RepID=A0ABX0R702_9GAMM|nr:transposase [Pantoea multigeneris]